MSLKIYKASAGSGKTYQLSLEYICLALETGVPSAFAHILAVTFTNKATAEMKSRILSYLYDLAYLHAETAFMAQVAERLALPPAEVSRRAATVLTAILHNYDQFRVETIDSFLQSLLSGLAYELGLSRRFKVDLDVDGVVSRAVDRLLLTAGNNEESMRRVGRFLQRYMEDKVDEGKGWAIARDLKDFAKKQLFSEEYLAKEAALTRFLHNAEGFKAFVQANNALKEQCQKTLEQAARLMQSVLSDQENAPGLKSLKTLHTYAQTLLDGNYTKAPAATIGKVIADPLELVRKASQNNAAATAAARAISETLSGVEDVRNRLSRTLTTLQLTAANLLPLRLLNEIGCEVTAINQETDTFMLARTPDFFHRSVAPGDSSFIFERSGTTFNHVMIDEFQDTSHMQWDIFRQLLLENIAQGEENLIVGDIKQSIYRWRGGDWRILAALADEMRPLGPVEERNLATNYRSREIVVRFNNEFFERTADCLDARNIGENLTTDSLVTTIYNGVAQQVKPTGSAGGYVRLTLFGDDPNREKPKKEGTGKSAEEKAAEAQAAEDALMQSVHDAITELHDDQGIPYDQMVILVRKNREATQLIDYFTEHWADIPLTSDEAFRLSASPAVMLLVSAIKYITDPDKDTTSWALCERMAQRLADAGCLMPPLDAKALLKQRAELLAMPLYELCQRLIRLFGLPKAEQWGAGQSASLFYFLDHVLAILDDHASSLPEFIDYWDNTLSAQFITANVSGSIRLMTIHKAKGLQRHTVLVPFCQWRLDDDKRGEILWCETDQDDNPCSALPLAPVTKTTRAKQSAYERPYLADHLNQRIDCLNMLYVALTRAETNLLIWGSNLSKSPDNSVKALLENFVTVTHAEPIATPDAETDEAAPPSRTYIYGTLAPYAAKARSASANPLEIEGAEQVRVSLSERATEVRFRQSNEAARFVRSLDEEADGEEHEGAQQNDYILRGNLLHFIFSLIRTADDLPAAMAQALQRGLFASAEDETATRRAIESRLSDPVAKQWFDGSWTVTTECDILTPQPDGSVMMTRPDRVMTRPGETVVVDYKTGAFRPAYDDQVRGYMATLTEMGYPAVRGYLWMLATGEVREVH